MSDTPVPISTLKFSNIGQRRYFVGRLLEIFMGFMGLNFNVA